MSSVLWFLLSSASVNLLYSKVGNLEFVFVHMGGGGGCCCVYLKWVGCLGDVTRLVMHATFMRALTLISC